MICLTCAFWVSDPIADIFISGSSTLLSDGSVKNATIPNRAIMTKVDKMFFFMVSSIHCQIGKKNKASLKDALFH
jgi:hypothetical protein